MESEDYGFYKGLEFLAENSVGIQRLSFMLHHPRH